MFYKKLKKKISLLKDNSILEFQIPNIIGVFVGLISFSISVRGDFNKAFLPYSLHSSK